MLFTVVLMSTVAWLAWSNGANDNFKGVATLYGSGTTSYRTALWWATAATLAGSVVSIAVASGLAKSFGGSGLVAPELVQSPALLMAVGVAGAATVFIATVIGMPTSTTHALTGALVGAGLASSPSGINWTMLTQKFAQPLLISPVLAVAAAALLYVVLRAARHRFGVERETCVCVGVPARAPVAVGLSGNGGATIAARSAVAASGPISVGSSAVCRERYRGRVLGIDAHVVVDVVHYLSGASVCFARAVNDTPKIAAILIVSGGTLASWQLGLVAVAMVAGGMIGSRRVARTMSQRITELNPGQGLTANLVTSSLVLGASHLGVPVSTTHVSCGSIFGIGMINRQRRWRTIAQILVTWVTTLPVALGLGAGAAWMLRHVMG